MLFAISDLHLSFGADKPMDIFGENWKEHEKKLDANWRAAVSDDDVVIIPGDISWGRRMDGFIPDFEFIKELPGKKVLIRGNHDYWWNGIGRLNAMDENIYFLQNTAVQYGDIFICGTRGWICPGYNKYGNGFTAHDLKIYKREAGRLKASLEVAKAKGAGEILAAMHYPPFNRTGEKTLFMELFAQYPVKRVIYGHLHNVGEDAAEKSYYSGGISFRLVSADSVGFSPVALENRNGVLEF